MPSIAIEVTNIKKKYISKEGFRKKKIVEALKGISFEVRKGKIHALLGPNGAGKTTTMKILSTLLLPDEGTAKILGYDVISEADSVRRIIGVVLDITRGFIPWMTGRQNLMYFALLQGLGFKEAKRRVSELLKMVGLEDLNASDRVYRGYSLGMRARLALAKALIKDPPVLLLDEPMVGLDVYSIRWLRSLLIRLVRDEGKTILITGHNVREIELIADGITVIDKGIVVAHGEPHKLMEKYGLFVRFELNLRGEAEDLKRVLSEQDKIAKYDIEVKNGMINATIYAKAEREEAIAILTDIISQSKTRLISLRMVEPTLEDLIITLTKPTIERGD